MTRVDECVAKLTASAGEIESVELLLDEIICCLADQLTPFTFMAVLFEVFEVPVRELHLAAGWEGIGSGGTRPTDEVVEVLEPWVRPTK